MMGFIAEVSLSLSQLETAMVVKIREIVNLTPHSLIRNLNAKNSKSGSR